MAGTAQERVNSKRQKINDEIKALDKELENTKDSKQRKRINAQKKRLVRQRNDLNQRPGAQRIGIDAKGGTKGRVAVDTGKQAHHRTSLNNAAQFYDGLDLAEKNIMDQKMASLGIVPADVTLNRLDMFQELHQGGIHALERELDLEGKEYFPKGATFEQKLAAVEEFAADQRLLSSLADRSQFTAENELQGFSRRVESTATDKLAEEFHAKGQRRRKEQTRDFKDYQPETHAAANALGPQTSPDNSARLAALEPYVDKGSVKLSRLKMAKRAGVFALPAVATVGLSGQAAKASQEEADADPTNLFKQGIAISDKIGYGADLVETAATPLLATPAAPIAAPVVVFAGGVANVSAATSTLLDVPEAIERSKPENVESIDADAMNQAYRDRKASGNNTAPDDKTSQTFTKLVSDPLNELEWGWKRLTGQAN